MTNLPGTNGKPFKIILDGNHFAKGEVIKTGEQLLVVSDVNTLPLSKWKRLLVWLGFRKIPFLRWYLSKDYWYEVKPVKDESNNRRNEAIS